jgi:hypothetical protein
MQYLILLPEIPFSLLMDRLVSGWEFSSKYLKSSSSLETNEHRMLSLELPVQVLDPHRFNAVSDPEFFNPDPDPNPDPVPDPGF